MLSGDIRGQFELAAVILVGLFIVLPVMILARLVARSRLGRFIHANPSTTRVYSSKKLVVNLVDEPNSLFVVQGLMLLLFLLAGAVSAVVLVMRWLAR